MPQSVRLREVGPRDGFQNEPEVIPTDAKVELIEALARTLPREGVDPRQVQVLTPMRVGRLGSANLNEVLAGMVKRIDAELTGAAMFDPVTLAEAKGLVQ